MDALNIKNFDFTKGGVVGEINFPALKSLDQAQKYVSRNGSCEFIVYEPGNGTRYELFMAKRGEMFDDPALGEMDGYFPKMIVAIMNFGRPCCMGVPAPRLNLYNIDYICEKMGVLAGDAYALIPIINDFLERHRGE